MLRFNHPIDGNASPYYVPNISFTYIIYPTNQPCLLYFADMVARTFALCASLNGTSKRWRFGLNPLPFRSFFRLVCPAPEVI